MRRRQEKKRVDVTSRVAQSQVVQGTISIKSRELLGRERKMGLRGASSPLTQGKKRAHK